MECPKYRNFQCTYCYKYRHAVDVSRRKKQVQSTKKRYVKLVSSKPANKHQKKAAINGIVVHSLIGMDSETTLIRESAVMKLNLKIDEQSKFIKLHGFNGSKVRTKSKCFTTIKIDGIKAVQDHSVYVAFHTGIDTGRTFNPIKFIEVSF